ncbi:MAG: hypothetical protein ACOC92_01210 [bacterium]
MGTVHRGEFGRPELEDQANGELESGCAHRKQQGFRWLFVGFVAGVILTAAVYQVVQERRLDRLEEDLDELRAVAVEAGVVEPGEGR